MSNNYNKIPDAVHKQMLDHLSVSDHSRMSRSDKMNHKRTSAHMLKSLSQLERMPPLVLRKVLEDLSPKQLCSLNMGKKISSMKLPALVNAMSRKKYSKQINHYIGLHSPVRVLTEVLNHMTKDELVHYILKAQGSYPDDYNAVHPKHAVQKWLNNQTLKEICQIVRTVNDEETEGDDYYGN
jgi:hypothetical protein